MAHAISPLSTVDYILFHVVVSGEIVLRSKQRRSVEVVGGGWFGLIHDAILSLSQQPASNLAVYGAAEAAWLLAQKMRSVPWF